MSDDATPPAPAPMTAPASAPAAAPTPTRSNNFFRKTRTTPLAPDKAQRQGDITSLAFLTMGGRDPALAFLNAENVALGGRPLAIATASAAGYAAVASAIRAAPPAAGGA